jgi:hypothetical protein
MSARRWPPHTVAQHFEGRTPAVKAIYEAVLTAARKVGPFQEDPKRTSIHLSRTTVFAGVAARKDALILTLKSAKDLIGPRVVRRERASANRWHVAVRLESPADVDAEVCEWLAAAYELSA